MKPSQESLQVFAFGLIMVGLMFLYLSPFSGQFSRIAPLGLLFLGGGLLVAWACKKS